MGGFSAGAARCSGKAQKRPGQKAFHGRSSVGKSWARPSAEAESMGDPWGILLEIPLGDSLYMLIPHLCDFMGFFHGLWRFYKFTT